MSKKKDSMADAAPSETNDVGGMLRVPAEVFYAKELEALIQADKHDKPPGWRMSPRAVLTYICGGSVGGTADGTETPPSTTCNVCPRETSSRMSSRLYVQPPPIGPASEPAVLRRILIFDRPGFLKDVWRGSGESSRSYALSAACPPD